MNESQKSTSNGECPLYWAEFIGYFYVHTIVCFVGFWMNLVGFLVFQKRYFRRIVHYFMASLALFDALTLLITMPQGLVRCSQYPVTYMSYCHWQPFTNFRLWMYHASIYAGFATSNITEFVSSCLILILTWERYQAMRGLCQANIKSSSYASKILALVVASSIVLNLPLFFVQRSVNVSKHTNLTTWNTIYTEFGKSMTYGGYLWTRLVVLPILLLLTITVLSILLIKVTHTSFKNYTRQLGDHRDLQVSLLSNTRSCITPSLVSQRQRIEFTLTSLLLFIILLFIVGQFPQAFSFGQLYRRVTSHCPIDELINCCFNYKMYRMLSTILAQISYSVPFIVYVKFDRTFRRALLELISCRRSRNEDDNLAFQFSQETFNVTSAHKTLSSPETGVVNTRESLTKCCSQDLEKGD